MSLLFMTSFEHVNNSTINQYYSNYSAGLGSQGIVTGGRHGGKCLHLAYAGSIWLACRVPADNWFYFGVAMKHGAFGAGGSGFQFYDINNSLQSSLKVSSNGTMTAQRYNNVNLQSSLPIIETGKWYYFEIGIQTSDTGKFKVRVDGETVIDFSGDTMNTGQQNIAYVRMYGGGNGMSVYFDDIYWCDGSGSDFNTFLGDIAVEALFPIGAGANTDWNPSTGNNWECVDETAPNTTDYIYTTVSGYTDSYEYSNLSSVSGIVLATQALVYQQGPDGGKIKFVTRPVSTDYYSYPILGQEDLDTSWSYGGFYNTHKRQIQTVNPETLSGWTINEINNTEFGISLEV